MVEARAGRQAAQDGLELPGRMGEGQDDEMGANGALSGLPGDQVIG